MSDTDAFHLRDALIDLALGLFPPKALTNELLEQLARILSKLLGSIAAGQQHGDARISFALATVWHALYLNGRNPHADWKKSKRKYHKQKERHRGSR